METPIVDFIQSYADKNVIRLHTPGHKGKSHPKWNPCYAYDITEIEGADSLFSNFDDGIIRTSECNTSLLYNSAKTVFSTSGSTLAIQTMFALAAVDENKRNTVVASRNAHIAFINSCALLDLEVQWITPSPTSSTDSIISYNYTIQDIECAIVSVKNPSCVYVTSPDYFGRMLDIAGISELCKKYNLPLLVDNAHGAHLAFLPENIHPLNLGADLCCDSAHKMLPALTGGAYLHIGKGKFAEKYSKSVKDTMSLFASTSPSYLILASLDLCNPYLKNYIRNDLNVIVSCLNSIKKLLSNVYEIINSDPLRLTIHTPSTGLTGSEIANILRENNIECEYSDQSYIVLLFSPINNPEEIQYVYDVLSKIKMPRIRLKIPSIDFSLLSSKRIMSIKEATFSSSTEISINEALNRICGKTRVSCPPGIPIVVAGEIITQNHINILKNYSIFTVNVVS